MRSALLLLYNIIEFSDLLSHSESVSDSALWFIFIYFIVEVFAPPVMLCSIISNLRVHLYPLYATQWVWMVWTLNRIQTLIHIAYKNVYDTRIVNTFHILAITTSTYPRTKRKKNWMRYTQSSESSDVNHRILL